MATKKFTIKVEMEERWADTFCSMLKEMEKDGNIGHSEWIGFYADGDGDFRPKFSLPEFNQTADKFTLLHKYDNYPKNAQPKLINFIPVDIYGVRSWVPSPIEHSIKLYDADFHENAFKRNK